MSQVLYYPWIDIRDEGWLKTSLLYWDNVRTIVPDSISDPYTTRIAKELYDIGFLTPLEVHSNIPEISSLSDDVIKFLDSKEANELMMYDFGDKTERIHVDKISRQIIEAIHYRKIPFDLQEFLETSRYARRKGQWMEVHQSFGRFYMTLLATRMAETIGASLATNLQNAKQFAHSVKLDAILSQTQFPIPRSNIPTTVLPGLIAELSFKKIGIPDDTPLNKLLDFRSSHLDEVKKFRSAMEKLTTCTKEELPIEALLNKANDIYNNEVVTSVNDLKSALKGNNITSISQGLYGITFFSVGSSLLLSSISAPLALIAGLGISLIVSRMRYNTAKEDIIRNNPLSYLLSIEKNARKWS